MAADQATIAAWNLVSRVTGFARVLVVAGALGVTFLGNTYQSSNLVSNIVFELLAGGLLTVPLVPVFVRLYDGGDREGADRLTSTLLGLVVVALGAVALAGAFGARPIMALLTSGVADAGIREEQIRLGAILLRFFLPQLVLYGIGAVVTARLHAARRFAAAAAAPVLNNLIVIGVMVAYMTFVGTGQDLALSPGIRLLLGLGTTLGVLAMTLLPVAALARSGGAVRPRWHPGDPALRELGRMGAWGALMLAANQGLVAVTLLLANRVEGGVVAYQVAFAFFLLPVALVAHPVFTAAHPRLSAEAVAGRWSSFAEVQAEALRRIVTLVVPAGVVVSVAAGPAVAAIRFGALDAAGAALVGRVVVAYALGLGGYAVFLLLTRSATAAGRADLPAKAALFVLGLGTGLMVVVSRTAPAGSRVLGLGLAHSLAWTAGAFALAIATARATGAWDRVGRAVGHAVLAAAAAAAVGIGARLGAPPVSGRLFEGAVGGVAGAMALAAALAWLAVSGNLRRSTPALAAESGL